MPDISSQKILVDWNSEIQKAGIKAWCVDRCGSTMDLARTHAEDLSIGELGLVIAREQSSGRGRRGNKWLIANGAFTGTWIFPTNLAPEQVSGLSLVVGLAVKRVINDLGGQVKLKWPNDVLTTKGEKISGLLIEALPKNDLVVMLIGLGVNLVSKPELAQTSSVYEVTNQNIPPDKFGRMVSEKLKELLADFSVGGFASFQSEWERDAAFIGEKISFEYDGAKRQGKMLGVNKSGHLLVELDGRELNLVAGDVAHVRSYS